MRSQGLSGVLEGSRGLSRAVQGQMGGSLSGKSYVHDIYFSLDDGGINTDLDQE